MIEDYRERMEYAKTLEQYITTESNEQHISFTTMQYNLPTLEALPDPHLRALAGANRICSSDFLLRSTPSILLKNWLKVRAQEIALG